MINISAKQTSYHSNGIVTGTFLKWLAMVTMVIDHIGALIMEPWLTATGGMAYANIDWDTLYMTTRLIGRLAFPIFCFLIVEGFFHTRNVKKYAQRLLLFALVSEIPFNLGVSQQFFDFSHQNVFFTLLAGLLAIWALDQGENAVKRFGPAVLLVMGAELLNTDYGAYGVFMIILLYGLRANRVMQAVVGAVYNLAQMTACLAFIPLYFYNGEKGRGNVKWLYWIYPVHILLFALIYRYLLSPY